MIADDHVIQHVNSHDLARIVQAAADRQVFFARFDGAGRVIVGHNDRAGILKHGELEDFAGRSDGRIEVADGDRIDTNGFIFGIQGQDDQVFPVGLAADELAENVVSVSGGADLLGWDGLATFAHQGDPIYGDAIHKNGVRLGAARVKNKGGTNGRNGQTDNPIYSPIMSRTRGGSRRLKAT